MCMAEDVFDKDVGGLLRLRYEFGDNVTTVIEVLKIVLLLVL